MGLIHPLLSGVEHHRIVGIGCLSVDDGLGELGIGLVRVVDIDSVSVVRRANGVRDRWMS